jgi:hypothetical protein
VDGLSAMNDVFFLVIDNIEVNEICETLSVDQRTWAGSVWCKLEGQTFVRCMTECDCGTMEWLKHRLGAALFSSKAEYDSYLVLLNRNLGVLRVLLIS